MSDALIPPSRGRLLMGGEHYRSGVERATGWSDDRFHPQTIEGARAALAPQVLSVRSTAAEIPEELRANRTVFEATLLPNYLANMHFPANLVKEFDLSVLGSRSHTGQLETRNEVQNDVPTKSLILAADDAQLGRLHAMITSGGQGTRELKATEELRRFSEISIPDPGEIIDHSISVKERRAGLPVWEAVLHPDPDTSRGGLRSASRETFAKFVAHVSRLNGQVIEQQIDIIGSLTYVPVALAEDQVEELAKFNPLRSINLTPRLRPVRPTSGLRGRAPATRIPHPPKPQPTQMPSVLVFDAGVDHTSPYFAESVSYHDRAPLEPAEGYLDHGEAVTATVLYGSIIPGQQLPPAAANITHYRVVPSEDNESEMYAVLDEVEAVLSALPPGQIVNLSLGPEEAYEINNIHRWTAKIDQIAFERDALFVVAAGNNGGDDPEGGFNRVQPPGDAVNVLCVGAYGSRQSPLSRATYSAVGPGRSGARILPAGTCFGGSMMEPFLRLNRNGELTFDEGTSYAAPLATHGVVKLAGALGSQKSASMLKALSIHFAEPFGPHTEVGYGKLRDDYSDCLEYDKNRVTVMYQLQIARDEVVAIELPAPTDYSGQLSLRYSAAFMCPTQPTESAEYTTAGIEAVFRPHAGKFRLSDPSNPKRQRVIDIIKNGDEYRRLQHEGWKPSTNPASRQAQFASGLELSRREHGGKWETSIRVDHSLRGSSLFHPRLDLNYISRKNGEISKNDPPLSVAVVVSIEAKRGVNLYDQVLLDFPALVEITPAVSIPATEIDVTLDSKD